MNEYRCTRPDMYRGNCPGAGDPSARQGHYIDAEDEADAHRQMRADYPSDSRFAFVPDGGGMTQCDGKCKNVETRGHDDECPMANETTAETARSLAKRFGSRFTSCPCGRKRVLLYYRKGDGATAHTHAGEPDEPADRITHHNTPHGVACSHGGKHVLDVSGAKAVQL